MNRLHTVVAQADSSAPDFVREHFPRLVATPLLGVAAWQWVAICAAVAGSLGMGAAFSRLFHLISRSFSGSRETGKLVSLSRAIQSPLASLVALGVFDWALHVIDLAGHISLIFDALARQLLIIGVAWLLSAAGRALAADLEGRFLGDDEFSNRGVRTRVRFARHVWNGLVVLIALVLVLSGFQAIRTIGLSILASAGIVGVVVGVAAQKSLGGIVAGLQLSMTQQIRIGDTVIVDEEFGTVEEIHLTFVVLRLWDLRRMVVPATRFLEHSFQNWTRVRTHLLGAVELWVDYAAPLAPLREELARVCKASPLWNGESYVLQVTAASDRALKIRMMVSAATPTNLFDLRCEVREKVVALLQSLGGGVYLPQDRTSDARTVAAAEPSLPAHPSLHQNDPVASSL